MGTAFFLAALLQASPLFGNPQVAANPVAVGRPVTLTTTWQGRPITARLSESAMSGCGRLDWLYGVTANAQDRCSRLASLEISIRGRKLTVPATSYADLGDIHQALLKADDRHILLYLRGSEGAEDYGATLSFDSSGLVARDIYWPDGTAEKTSYTSGD